MKKRNYTTKDIAALAKVSRGTVDRVIHKRGKVSDAAEEKVLKVLKEIDYKPNVIAKALRTSREFSIAILMPSMDKDEYWKDASDGVNNVIEEYQMYNVHFDFYYFDQGNRNDFKEVGQTVFSDSPDGIILAPFFYSESLYFLKHCSTNNIPCITFNTHIPESNTQQFIGQDLVRSGMVAASLIDRVSNQSGSILIAHFDENLENAVHMQEKEEGFRSYFSSGVQKNITLLSTNIKEDNQDKLYDQLDSIFGSKNDIIAVFVTTSKSYKVAQYIKHNSLNCKLVGYDILQKNADFLISGEIDFLIHQNVKTQAKLAATQMAEYLVMAKNIPAKTILPLDIIIKENINSYLHI